jgi:hypothetical protein
MMLSIMGRKYIQQVYICPPNYLAGINATLIGLDWSLQVDCNYTYM